VKKLQQRIQSIFSNKEIQIESLKEFAESDREIFDGLFSRNQIQKQEDQNSNISFAGFFLFFLFFFNSRFTCS